MTCDHDWTFKFRGINDESGASPLEVRPISMSLKKSRSEYNFVRAKLSYDVGEMMKPHTRYSTGKLYGIVPVDVCLNGDPIHRLLFRPDWISYGSQYTHLTLHDLHKSLADGILDIQRQKVRLEEIYQEVVNGANNRIIDEVKFTVPDEQVRTIYGQSALNNTRGNDFDGARDEVLRDKTKAAVDSSTAVDFDQISPEKALQRLNKIFQLRSWINSEGVLVVGLPEAKQVTHLAAPRDERVWRYKDPSINHSREPIRKVMVEGAWVDEPGVEHNPAEWFNKGGTADVRAIGIAKRTDIDYGKVFSVSATKAKKDSLAQIAELALTERMKEKNSGTVEIDPDISGTTVSDPKDVQPGDYIRLVPEDSYYDNPTANSGAIGDSPDPEEICGEFTNNETYRINEVEHNLTEDGSWQIFCDLGLEPNITVRSFMTYFEPSSGEWVEAENVADDGSLKKDGWLENI